MRNVLLVVGILALVGCGDDAEEPAGQAGSAQSAGAGQGGGAGQAGSAQGGAGASAGAGGEQAGGAGQAGSGGAPGGAGGSPAGAGGAAGAGEVAERVALVLGTLAETDPVKAKAAHDQIASGGEQAAKAAGDTGHKVMLGTKMLGTAEGQFFAMDRWKSPDNIDAFYGNKDFQAAFGTLFSAPPSLTIYVHQPKWINFGGLNAGDTFTPHFWVVVRAKLKEADPAKAQAAHDGILSQVKPHPNDVAHVVFTGRDDPQSFLAVDIWKTSDELEAFYSNPDLAGAFGMLFEGAPTLGVYTSTDWHQW